MESHKATLPKELGDMLVAAKIITEDKLNHVKKLHAESGDTIEHILLLERLITPQQLAFFTSLHLRVPFVNLKKEGVRSNAVTLIPETIARKYSIIPIDITDGTLVVAMSDPRDIEAIEELATLTRKRRSSVIFKFSILNLNICRFPYILYSGQ